MAVLEIHHLYKSFGSNAVIKDLNLSVSENKIFGFIGQNGAGKTTTMKMILGLLKADRGFIRVCGEKVRYGETKTNRLIGYLPDVPEYYGFMNAPEYLKLCGEITGMDKVSIRLRSEELLHLVGLQKEVKKRISGYSRGMRQRLGIAQALLNDPRLLICDEPTSALDPVGRKEILEILRAVKNKTTVVFSTHILSDVERICDDIAILDNGKIVISGTLDEIRNSHSGDSLKLEFQTEKDLQKFAQLFPSSQTIKTKIPDSRTILIYSAKIKETQRDIMGLLYQNVLMPLSMEYQGPTLENLFMEVVK